jgi:hypothetical protein
MATAFTKNLEGLLDQQTPKEKPSAFSDNGNYNGIEKKSKTTHGKEEIVSRRYQNNQSLSPNIETYEQLDALYKYLAKSIPIQVEAMTREQSLEIAPLNFRPFEPETDNIRKIKPTKLYHTDTGITFGYQKTPLTITAKSKVQKKSFPDFKMIVLDNSDSMREGIDGNRGNTSSIPWGDNSKYHYALLGFYGIENFLQEQSIAQYMGHGLSLFSSDTRYEESDFKDIQKLRRLALSPEFEGTQIEASTLLEALKGKESFVLSISDGNIFNWSDIREEFKKLASENYFAHIQMGSGNEFTGDLEEWGLPVFQVNSGEELSKLMVNTTTNMYRRFISK